MPSFPKTIKLCVEEITHRTPVPPVSSTNKTDRHDITEILLKVALSTIKQTHIYPIIFFRNMGF
jgi:hypothetical protein